MKEVKEELDDVIRDELKNLSKLESGSEVKSKAVEDVVKLYKLRIEETKAENEDLERYGLRGLDREKEENSQAEKVRDRYFKTGVEVLGIVLPLAFYAVWMRRGFRFEETGTYTSQTFRGLFNRFKPTK